MHYNVWPELCAVGVNAKVSTQCQIFHGSLRLLNDEIWKRVQLCITVCALSCVGRGIIIIIATTCMGLLGDLKLWKACGILLNTCN